MVNQVSKKELTAKMSRLYGRVCDAEYGDGDVVNLTAEVRDTIGEVHRLLDEAIIAERVNGDLRLAVSFTNNMNSELKRQLGLTDGHCMGSYAKVHKQKERIAELETEVERLKSDLTAATNSINNATEKFGLTGEGSFTDQLSAYFNEKIVSRYAFFEGVAADSSRYAKDLALYHATGARPQFYRGGEIPEVNWRDDPYQILSQILPQPGIIGSGERLQAYECVPGYNKRAPMSYAFEPPLAPRFTKQTGIPVGIMWDVLIVSGKAWARKVRVECAGEKESRVSCIGSGMRYYVRNSNLYPWSFFAYPEEEKTKHASRISKVAESCLRLAYGNGEIHPSVCKGDVRFMLTNDRVEPVKVTVMQVKGQILVNGCWWSMAVVKDDVGAMWSVPVKRLHPVVPDA